jgi:bifunctional DNA-binding transcriptional regulator/antitoxin component of YhaV-PrlF toxin-antitoxin module
MALVSQIEENAVTHVPDEIIRKAGLKTGDQMIWYYDDVKKHIIIVSKPKSYAKTMRGLGSEVWKGLDPVRYIQEERDGWE